MHFHTCGCTTSTCGCCDGVRKRTPADTANRPGLSALAYRAGAHGEFFDTMKARLSTMTVDAPGADGQTTQAFRPLTGFTTRDTDDPTIALLDGWATVGDVLTFYQERAASEGYLRTATLRRSVLEMARLVGYELRPGVASSVYLAYEIDDNQVDPVEIPIGAKSQSIPAPGEFPQTFETAEKIVARKEWNSLKARQTRPQEITVDSVKKMPQFYVSGTATNLKTGDKLLFEFKKTHEIRYVASAEPDFTNNRTLIKLQSAAPPAKATTAVTTAAGLADKLLVPPIEQARNKAHLARNLKTAFADGTDSAPQLLLNFQPRLKDKYYAAWEAARFVKPDPPDSALVAVYVLRVTATPFGSNVAHKFNPPKEQGPLPIGDATADPDPDWSVDKSEDGKSIYLDQIYDTIAVGSPVIIQSGTEPEKKLLRVQAIEQVPRTAYGISGKSTRLTLSGTWWSPDSKKDTIDKVLRTAILFGQAEELTVIENPIDDDVAESEIDLSELYKELESGRWVVVSGERTDIPGVAGVYASELMMIAALNHAADPPTDKTRTTLQLATTLAHTYKRSTVTINANVLRATHGDTRAETLGSGDGAQVFHTFALKQSPLTFTSAPTVSGVESTLKVYVNDVEWHEESTLAAAAPTGRIFVTKTDDDVRTSITFGNGIEGARLPTGIENIKAIYRVGIGEPGNVKAMQVSLVLTKPLGVKAVSNPLAASGGADRESLDQARENAPLAVMALDRLVSRKDYEFFTRTFAGIGKAAVKELTDGKRPFLHLTIAGAADAAIDKTSDLYRNLVAALRLYGDPDFPIRVDARELIALVASIKVRIGSDYLWDKVTENVRSAVLEEFSFTRRALAQPALLCELISTVQAVEGVTYVDMDAFGGIPEKRNTKDSEGAITRQLLTPHDMADRLSDILAGKNSDPGVTKSPYSPAVQVAVPAAQASVADGIVIPAQLAIFTPAVPDTLILNQIV